MTKNWHCPKCDNTAFETDEITTTGSGLSKFFNIQNRKYTAVTCTRCHYTEFYRGSTSTLSNVLDFFGN